MAAGSLLGAWPGATLLHVTDGAPRDPWFAAHAGVVTRAAYAALRAGELERALATGGARCRRVAVGLVDQEAALALVELARAVARAIADTRPDVVVTHAYEGGHPDHDAAAFAVAAALRLTPSAPPVVEMASYHERDGALVSGDFLPGGAPAVARPLDGEARRRKRAMLDCFESQRQVLARFNPDVERFRVAPRYDFASPPHPGPLHYERFGWPVDGARFRRLAAAALAMLMERPTR